MLSFKPAFSLSSFSFIKRIFISSSLSAIRVVSPAYLRLLIFLLAILIPACESFSPAFCLMYSTYNLNKQDDNRQACHTPFPILNQSVFPCRVLTVASWVAYRFLRRQVRWFGIPISKNFPQFVVIHTVKVFQVVNALMAFVISVTVFLISGVFFLTHSYNYHLFTLLICSCTLSTSSIRTLSMLIIVVLNPQPDNSIISAISESGFDVCCLFKASVVFLLCLEIFSC